MSVLEADGRREDWAILRRPDRITLKTGVGVFNYPASRFGRDVQAWNSLVLAGLIVSGTVRLGLNYPDNYEYRWIFDPIIERVPVLRSHRAQDYYALLLLTEDFLFTGRPGPAGISTINRIVEYVGNGWKVSEDRRTPYIDPKYEDYMELATARLLAVHGYYGTGRVSVYENSPNRLLTSNYSLPSSVFTEELVKQYWRPDRPAPIVHVELSVGDGRERLDVSIVERTVSSMMDGTLAETLNQLLRMGHVDGRVLEAHTSKNNVHIKLSSTWTGGEPAILEYSVPELLGRVNRYANVLAGQTGRDSVPQIILDRSAHKNIITVRHGDKDFIVHLQGDHATILTGDYGRIIGKHRTMSTLVSELVKLTGDEPDVIFTICDKKNRLEKYARTLAETSGGGLKCPVLDEIVLARTDGNKTVYIGKSGDIYYRITLEGLHSCTMWNIKTGRTLEDVASGEYSVHTPELDEANTILEYVLHTTGSHHTGSNRCLWFQYTTSTDYVLVARCPPSEHNWPRKNMRRLAKTEDDEYVHPYTRPEHARLLGKILEQYGWERREWTDEEGDTVVEYRKKDTLLVFIPKRLY